MDDQSTSREALAESRTYGRGHGTSGEGSTEPDVLLDVPQLRVEEIKLDVEDLRARVSVEADVLNLLRLSVGADVQLGGVHLEIKGVEAQVLLKVRLDKVAEIINRVLTSVDRNPEIVGQIVPPLGDAVGELGPAAPGLVDELARAVDTTAPGVGRSVAETVEEAGQKHPAPGEHAAAVTPAPEDESAGAAEGASPGLLRRRKREGRKTEEPPP